MNTGDGDNSNTALLSRLIQRLTDDMSPRERLGVFVPAVGTFAFTILTPIVLFSVPEGERVYVGAGGAAAILLCLLVMYFAAPKLSPLDPLDPSHPPPPEPDQTGETLWARTLPLLDRADTALVRDIQSRISEIHAQAVAIIRRHHERLPEPIEFAAIEHVRVNLFAPQVHRAEFVNVCDLVIPPGMHANMSDERSAEELKTRFRIDEGLTGRVFHLGEPQGIHGTSLDRSWDWRTISIDGSILPDHRAKPYRLTEDHLARISPDLRWLISIPLQRVATKPETTMAVLNIDGLDEQLSDTCMGEVYRELRAAAEQLAERVAAAPHIVLRVVIEETG